MKDYKLYMEMIRRSIERVNNNFKIADEKISYFHIGLELRHIEAVIEEAYDLHFITDNSHSLLRRWYRRYYDNIVHKIIWL